MEGNKIMADTIFNPWTWKDSVIIEELELRKVDASQFLADSGKLDRHASIAKLKELVLNSGEQAPRLQKGIMTIESIPDDEGNVTELSMDDLKEEDPKLILSRVVFHNKSEDDLPYVFVGHNGKAFYIPKEIEVDVPDYILDSCIKDAVEERMMVQTLMNGDLKWVTKRVQRFPYQLIQKSFPAPTKKEK